MARDLLRLGNRGPPRTAFLREASELLIDGSGADALVAWLEDGPRTFLWRAEGGPARDLRFELLPPCSGHETLLERASRAAGIAAAAASSRVRHLPAGGVYLAELEGHAPPRPALARGDEVGSLALLPFEIDDDNRGVLQLESASPRGFEDPDRLETTADLLGIAIAARRTQAARAERVKELGCMYGIARVGADPAASLDEMLARIVELLPPAWQYPEITTARIVVEGRAFLSPAFAEGPHCLAASIGGAGIVEVFYVPERGQPGSGPLLEDSPFLEEERHLIEGVAREVASIVARKRSDEDAATLQERVRRADRLATVGHLAAGLAHELNEPLGNILGFAQLALKHPELPPQAAEDLDWIVRSSLYAREVIKKLMLFARQTPSQLSEVDLNEIVGESLPLLASRSGSAGVSVQPELAPGPLRVRGDRGQLQQVFVNLAVNGIQAMPHGGELGVVTTRRGDEVVLEVRDEGQGISADVVGDIFEPFFTTKDVGEGTGLGLSVVHGIVTAHGGAIEVDSEPGRGTTMRVILPAPTATEERDGP